MIVQKFAQSNFKISFQETSILIDPGIYNQEINDRFIKTFDQVNAVFITHQHPDHLDLDTLKLLADKGIPIYGNYDVVGILGKISVKASEVKLNQEFELGSFKIKAIVIDHFELLFCTQCNRPLGADVTLDKKCELHPDLEPKLIDGPPNTGFLVNGFFFHPGDGIKISKFKVENASIPIAGPTIDYERAWELAESINPKLIIPMHYSNPKYPADPAEFAKNKRFAVDVKILDIGQSLEI